jgi:hypothetical protein
MVGIVLLLWHHYRNVRPLSRMIQGRVDSAGKLKQATDSELDVTAIDA